jgi:hypothetical protein
MEIFFEREDLRFERGNEGEIGRWGGTRARAMRGKRGEDEFVPSIESSDERAMGGVGVQELQQSAVTREERDVKRDERGE